MQPLHGDSYQDFVEKDSAIKAPEEICQVCGGLCSIKSENVGFTPPDPDYITFEKQCENGCDQSEADENVVII